MMPTYSCYRRHLPMLVLRATWTLYLNVNVDLSKWKIKYSAVFGPKKKKLNYSVILQMGFLHLNC